MRGNTDRIGHLPEGRGRTTRAMSALARHPTSARPHATRRLLLALELFIAVMAVGGAIYGLAGAENVPREWLEGSPFDSYVIPSLILLVAVGGGMGAAAAALTLRYRRAPAVSIGAGAVLLAWLAAQVLIIPFNWQQPIYALLALVVIGLGWRLRGRREPVGRPGAEALETRRLWAVSPQPAQRRPSWLLLSLPIALLGVAGSAAGIFVDSIDEQETENWAAQSVARTSPT